MANDVSRNCAEIQSQELGHCSPPRTPQLISKSGRVSVNGQDGGSRGYQQPQAISDSIGTKHNESQDAEQSAVGGSQPPPGFAAPAAARGKVVSSLPVLITIYTTKLKQGSIWGLCWVALLLLQTLRTLQALDWAAVQVIVSDQT